MTARVITLAGYAVLLGMGVLWWITTSRRRSLVTLPLLLARVTSSRPGRMLLVLAWAWLGWHLFARGSGAFE
jgi:Family of unknown function (DUF6186)